MTDKLTMPSPDLARKLMQSVGFEERLGGVKINRMGGSTPTAMFSLEQAAGFMDLDREAVLSDTVGKVTVGYVDPGALALWLEGVFGDDELAAAVRAANDAAESYADAVPPLKELLATRVEQCREVLAAESV